MTLTGRTVVVTRPEAQSVELVGRLRSLGAWPLIAPAIRILPPDDAALDQAVDGLLHGRFRWLVLTSANGVRALFERLAERGLRSPSELTAPIAAIGPGTRAALAGVGAEPALVPERYTTEALGEAMPRGSGEVLLARADIAEPGLEDALRAKGWTPVRVDAYRTEPVGGLPAELTDALDAGTVDAVTFTSASIVRGFLQALGPDGSDLFAKPARPLVVCIGPVTSDAAKQVGLPVDAVAEPHTIDGLVEALERILGGSAG